MTTIDEMDRMGPKVFSVVMAFACFRYALGGSHQRYSIDDCIKWLMCVSNARTKPHDQ